jgi:hypothetical protein
MHALPFFVVDCNKNLRRFLTFWFELKSRRPDDETPMIETQRPRQSQMRKQNLVISQF